MEFIKKNWKWLIVVSIILYTIVVVFITIAVYKNHLKNKLSNMITDSISEAFNVDTDKKENSLDKSKDTEKSNTKGKKINIGEKVTTEEWEIVLTGTEFKQDVVPPKTNSFYTHYEVSDKANTYLVVMLEAKNISTTELRGDDLLSIKAYYDNKYEYKGFCTVLDSDNEGFSTYENIKPLTTRTLYYLIEMPKELTNDEKSIKVDILIEKDTYEYEIIK
ncbi:MAG: hypothetical protein E7311_05910 [Clostridiales bacterium]|nr:hypothetical protein [Clostridiales bacterium]